MSATDPTPDDLAGYDPARFPHRRFVAAEDCKGDKGMVMLRVQRDGRVPGPLIAGAAAAMRLGRFVWVLAQAAEHLEATCAEIEAAWRHDLDEAEPSQTVH